MSTNDYVKFLTKELVTYLDKQSNSKEHKEVEMDETVKKEKVSYSTTLFGNIPLGLKMAIQKNIRKETAEKKDESTG